MQVQEQPAAVVVSETVRPRPRRLAVPVLALAVLLSLTATAAVAWSGAKAGVAGTAPRAVVLSGSSLPYVAGRSLADTLGWDAKVYTLPGGGISRSTLDPSGSITAHARRVLPAADGDPDVVLVQGGEADHAVPAAVVQRATEHLLDYLLAYSGGAEVVLVGPIPAANVPESLRAVNDLLQGVARSRGVAYVDAIAAGLQAGDPALADRLGQVLSGR